MDLRLSALNSLHSMSELTDQSVFSSHGLDPDRIKTALKQPPCDCKCSIPASVLTKACKGFWTLPKQAQDALLWSLQAEAGTSRKKWYIEGLKSTLKFKSFISHCLTTSSTSHQLQWPLPGYPLCRLAWTRYMGIGKQRLERCKRSFHGIDDRTINQGYLAN